MKQIVAWVVFITPLLLSGQVEIDKPLELTGAQNSDRQIKNLGSPVDPTDGLSVTAFQSGAHQYSMSTGSDGDYQIDLSPSAQGYSEGMLVRFKANHSNDDEATLNVDGLGSVPLTKNGSTPLSAGDIETGVIYEAIYDGSAFQLLNSASGGGGSEAGTPDYNLTTSTALVTTSAGANTGHDVAVITCSLISGSGSYLYPADTVHLSVSNLPAGVTYTLSSPFGHLVPSFQSNLIFTAGGSVANGDYSITITSDVAGNVKSTTVTLRIITGKVVFITTGTWQGNFGGFGGADSRCQTEASSSPFSDKTFVAFLGNSGTDPKDRIADALYYKPDGTVIALSKADFLDESFTQINMTANGAEWPSGTSEVWTGSNSNGIKSIYTCTNWSTNCSSGSGSNCYGGYGYYSMIGGGGGFCNTARRFFCFEQ